MKPIFFLVRLPLFILAIWAITALTLLLTPLAATLWILLLPPFWLIFKVPAKFFSAAFRNRPDIFSSYIKKSTRNWVKAIAEYFSGYGEMYQGLFKWLLHGNREVHQSSYVSRPSYTSSRRGSDPCGYCDAYITGDGALHHMPSCPRR
jgi:hypothetical protein